MAVAAGLLAAFLWAFPFPSVAIAAEVDEGNHAAPSAGAESESRMAAANLQEEFLFFSEDDASSIGSLHLKTVPGSPGIISVITSKTISAMAARHLTDVLKTVPSFDVGYNNFGEYFVSVNGVDNPSNVLVMLDGHRFNNFFTGGALYDVPVDGIDRIEIIRGPGSALYGTNAMVAVINVVSKKEEGTKIKAGGGSFNTYKANITFGAKGEETAVHAFAEIYDTAGGDGSVTVDRLANSASTKQYSKAPAKMKDDKRKFFGHVDADYKGTTVNVNMYTESRGPNLAYHDVVSDQSRVESGFVGIDIARNFDFAGKTSLTPRVYADRWTWDKKVQLYPNGYTDNRDLNSDGVVESFPNGEWMYKSYALLTYGVDMRLEKEWQNGHTATLGASAESSEIANTKVTTNYSGEPDSGAVAQSSLANWNNYHFPSRSRAVYAAYLQDDWTPNGYLNVAAGVRSDKYSDFGDTANPRVAVSVFPTERVALKLQYATAFRAPTFQELYDQTDLQFYGNPNLKPERIEALEAGLGYTYAPNSYVRVSAFRNTLKDYITTLFNTTQSQSTEYQNAGQLEINGYAVEAKHSYGDNSSFFWNASVFSAKDIQSDSWLTRVPQLRANAGIIQSLPYKSVASLSWMYSGTAQANARTNDERLFYNRAVTGPFNLVNLAFTKKGICEKYNLKLSAFNLLNADYKELYADTRYRFPNPSNTVTNSNLLPSNQRMLLLEIEREF